MLLRRDLAAALAALFLLFVAPTLALAQTPPKPFDVFTVSPVPVDATAASAAAARDEAIVQGESRAFDMLMQRLTLSTDRSRLPQVGPSQLNDLVQGFEVAHERRSDVRYLADFTVHFRADAVRQMLRQAGVGFAEQVSKPVIVLPVLHDGDRLALWDDPNPWRDAWSSAAAVTGLVPVVRPLGEIEDVQAIDAEQAAKGDAAALQAISRRYDGDDVLVTQATLKSDGAQHAVDVTTTRYAPDLPGTEQTWVTSTTANPGESDADLLSRAVTDTINQVEEAWKSANILDFRETGTLTARVPATSLQDWLSVRDRLAAIPAVRASRLVSLDRSEARVEIRYVGSADQLRTALAQRNLELGGSDPDWVLQSVTAAPPAAPSVPPALTAPPPAVTAAPPPQ
jgi:Uncharacterized protein conserved in bacteria (DUF2066)